jgi:sRNA-binding carbon storage regulator CsrA
MLVLTRREGESLDITVPPSDVVQVIRVSVQRIKESGEKPAKVSLGIEADKSIQILRDDAKKREQTESRRGNMGDGSGASPRWARNGGE